MANLKYSWIIKNLWSGISFVTFACGKKVKFTF